MDNNLNDTPSKTSFSLGSINTFGAFSHDVSLVHDDRALTDDEFAINQNLVEQLASKSTNRKTITFGQLAQFRKERAQDSQRRNKELSFGPRAQFIAFSEAAIFYLIFEQKDGVPIEAVRIFLGQEQLPDSFTKQKEEIVLSKVLSTTAALRLRAL